MREKSFPVRTKILLMFWSGGDRIRTRDLKVMSLASYQTAPPRDSFDFIERVSNKITDFIITRKPDLYTGILIIVTVYFPSSFLPE